MAKRLVLIPFLLFTLLPTIVFCQTDTSGQEATPPSPSPFAADSIKADAPTDSSFIFETTKEPLLSVGLSALLPGAGQIYNEDYWKVPVIWSLGGYWLYEWIDLNGKYKDYQTQYNQSLTATNADGDQLKLRLRDFYRDERDRFAWFMGGLYVLNLVDAFVGAHLYDFDVGPDLGGGARATVRLRF